MDHAVKDLLKKQLKILSKYYKLCIAKGIHSTYSVLIKYIQMLKDRFLLILQKQNQQGDSQWNRKERISIL